MIPSLPKLEKRLKKTIRALVRKDKAQWKEYKQRRRTDTHASVVMTWMFRVAILVMVLTNFRKYIVHLDVCVLALSAYATGLALWRGAMFVSTLYHSPQRTILFHYPVSDEEFLNLEMRRAFKASLWTLLLLAGIHALLAAGMNQSIALSLFLALSQWIIVCAVAIIAAAYWAHRHVWIPSFLLTLSAGAILFWFDSIAPRITGYPWPLLLVAPSGWLSAAFEKGLLTGQWEYLGLAFPPLLLLALVPSALRRIRRYYKLKEISIDASGKAAVITLVDVRTLSAPDSKLIDDYYDKANEGRVARETPEEQERLATEVRSGRFLKGMDWSAQPAMERIIVSWMTPGERRTLEFLSGEGVAWTRSAKRLAIILLVALLALSLFPTLAAYGALSAVLMFHGDILLGNSGLNGLKLIQFGTRGVPAYAPYPISYREISRVMLATNLMRSLVIFPLIVAFGALLMWRLNLSPQKGAEYATKSIAILMAAQPGMIGLTMLSGTSLTDKITLKMLFISAPLLAGMLMFIAACVFVFIQTDVPVLISAIIAAGSSALIWLYGKYLYERCTVDLIRTIQQQG